MPQYRLLVRSPAPSDPMPLTPDHVELLDRYPTQAKELGGKVLGGSYFSGQRGFAFEPSTTATAIRGDTLRRGSLVESDLDVAVRIAGLHPAVKDGVVEVRPLLVPPVE